MNGLNLFVINVTSHIIFWPLEHLNKIRLSRGRTKLLLRWHGPCFMSVDFQSIFGLKR
ncbi:hypothetical protein AXF42_Ash002933 [Apostasia shenzhenica]|uniref:Uncharacterized protein n=1 Tax=Apostasia shenzhenica TaxID=1088818 RepID=A0A2I0A7P1_9ASPA|nr:hypothetical protein AXF42_Ash002933 [Apostasia shenzhenica]